MIGSRPCIRPAVWIRYVPSPQARRDPGRRCRCLFPARGRRESVQRTGRARDPAFTIQRYRADAMSDNQTYLALREHIIDGMRQAGVPEG